MEYIITKLVHAYVIGDSFIFMRKYPGAKIIIYISDISIQRKWFIVLIQLHNYGKNRYFDYFPLM